MIWSMFFISYTNEHTSQISYETNLFPPLKESVDMYWFKFLDNWYI